MPFQQAGNIRFWTFDLLDRPGVTHAVFTRRGGVSPAPWASLNVGGTVGDNPHRVQENRRLTFQTLDLEPQSAFDVWQVHGAQAVYSERPRTPGSDYIRADIVLTDRPGVTLFMRYADCVPILLYDPRQEAVGLVHAGWQGTVRQAASVAVTEMVARFASRPQDLLAAIGPSIGPDHYQIGEEVASQVRTAFGPVADKFLLARAGAIYFDLWGANQWLLSQAGVARMEVAGLCTGCHLEDWYSHRLERGATGRFGALIALK